MPTTSTRQSHRDQQRQARRRDEQFVEKDDFADLLATEKGRRVAARILKECLIGSPVFSQNAMVMSANAGKHELGLWLQSRLREADMDNYLLMQTENNDA